MSENTERTVPPGNIPPESIPPVSGTAQRPGRQRRPTGAPPPLPHPFRVTTTAWLVLAITIVACIFLFSAHTQWLGLDDRANTGFLRLLAKARTPWLTDVADGIKARPSGRARASHRWARSTWSPPSSPPRRPPRVAWAPSKSRPSRA